MPNHAFYSEPVRLIEHMRRAQTHVLLGGPPGCGKSSFAYACARIMLPSDPIVGTCHEGMEAWELTSAYVPHDRGLKLTLGSFLVGWTEGRIVIANEVDR